MLRDIQTKKERQDFIRADEIISELKQINVEKFPTLFRLYSLLQKRSNVEIVFYFPSTEEEVNITSISSVCVTPASNDQLTLEEKNTDKDMLTVEETAELLRVSKPAVYKWIRNKQIDFIPPAINNGKGYLIPKAQFEDRLKRMEAYKHQLISAEHVENGYEEIQLVNPKDIFHDNHEEDAH